MIPVFKPLITMNERKAADKSLEIGWLGMGQYVNEFEKKIKSIIKNKNKYVVAVNTGHSALHLIMMLLKIKKGDQVITPSFNNIADLQAILAVGVEPVFCDVKEDTLCIDPIKAQKLINKKQKQ
jgi:dTDP-4-amino-4,6-dideoxygalactose transaminase